MHRCAHINTESSTANSLSTTLMDYHKMLPMHLLLFFIFAIVLQSVVRGASSLPHPGCPDKCGDVDIVYPFGIGPGCAMEEGFELHCNKSQDGQRNVTYFSNLPVADISLLQGHVRVMSHIASMCHNWSTTYLLDFRGTPFTVSEKENLFTVIGADTLALMAGSRQSAIVSNSPPLSHSHTKLLLGSGHLQHTWFYSLFPKDRFQCDALK